MRRPPIGIFKKAGTPDFCPECQSQFSIPGTRELAQARAGEEKLAREKAARHEAKEAARHQAQELKRHQQEAERKEKQVAAEKALPVEKTAAPAACTLPYPYTPPAQQKEPSVFSLAGTERRYPVLSIYRMILTVVGYLLIIIGLFMFAVSFARSVVIGESAIFLAGMLGMLPFVGSGSILVITAEAIKVFLDIEANTRKAAEK